MQLLQLLQVKYGKHDPFPWFLVRFKLNIQIRYSTSTKRVRFTNYKPSNLLGITEELTPIGSSVHKILNTGITK